MEQLKTIILRFRDLSVDSGQTIALHREICSRDGIVWWGWWNKAGEGVPFSAFRSLLTQIRESGKLEIFLFDTGGMRLYKATCSGIQFVNDGSKIPSPALQQTPSYYGSVPYKVWFRFSSIDADTIDANLLHQYSYLPVPEFFESHQSNFAAFDGKQVSSLKELKYQDRTIWFLRTLQKTDPTNEIYLLDNEEFNPTHFSPKIRDKAADTIVFLSDMHFSSDGHHEFPQEDNQVQLQGQYSLAHKVNDVLGEEGIAAMVLAGDFSWKAAPQEFAMARAFIGVMKARKSLKNYDILMCPGNHDIAFSQDPSNNDAPVTIAYDTAKKAYEDFYRFYYDLNPNLYLSMGRRFLLNRTCLVEIVCLNSSHLQQIPNSFQGHGFVGDDQLEDAKSSMAWGTLPEGKDGFRSPFRVLVVHHNIFPVTFRELPQSGRSYSVVLDAEAILRWAVEQRVDLIVHGHMHQPYCTKVERLVNPNDVFDQSTHCLYILGLGSVGVEKSHLGESGTNSFATAKFRTNQIEVKIHTVDPVNSSRLERTYLLPFK
jgi:predicted phosphodiesterase